MINIAISENIPLTDMISLNLDNPNKQIKLIIEKYILNSSDLMVNVSSNVRNQLINCYDNIENNSEDNIDSTIVKCEIFDNALLEVFGLLQSIFVRFK